MSLPTTGSSPTLSAQTFMPLLYAIAVPVPVVLIVLGGILGTFRCIRARRRKARAAAEQLDVEMVVPTVPAAPVVPPDSIILTRPSRDSDRSVLYHAWHGSARVNGRVSDSGLTVPLPAKFATWRSGPLPEPQLPSVLPQRTSSNSDVSSLALDEMHASPSKAENP
ncbi:hypothetical protein LTR86_005002 [Recurvomyces mirabilis]|nr:hypothetical protein LTR86_005002 [Recurvomyces mirabilis]